MSALFNIFAPTSTSSTSQTLQNTATKPIPATPIEDEYTARDSSSSLSSSHSTPKSAQPLKVKKRGRPKKVITIPQPAPEKATRGRGRPKKTSLSRQTSEAMARSRVPASVEIEEPRNGHVADTPAVDGEEDDSDDDGNDGEIGSELLNMAFDAVHNTTPKPANGKGKRGMPKGGWKNSKKTKATPTPDTRPTREAATKSAEKTSASYTLTSDPVADHSGLELAFENTVPKKVARGRKRASVVDEDVEVDEEGAAAPSPPPAKKRGRPLKNRVEPPVETTAGRARLPQGVYEPAPIDADETPFAGENMVPKRNRGRPSKEAVAKAAEVAGPVKGRGHAGKKLIDPDTLRIRGFTFGMQKVTTDGVQRDVLEAQFDFAVGGQEEGYEIQRTEDGGFRMNFNVDWRV
ncbi:hypothetical protein BLS_002292 [Venturia inaequalis]|uniref:Uncharacterized protein n=1 Tax=Venturia inaequalis TaxID=5025 RepID=A0A8H3Z104_VENIN|nr:hypothetical protein BLS_002292 [Venturia inaequalis]KAE9985311.1 hypothetical protein EG327_004725 [Venturia inaequalis]